MVGEYRLSVDNERKNEVTPPTKVLQMGSNETPALNRETLGLSELILSDRFRQPDNLTI
jgi:hypothetical protein